MLPSCSRILAEAISIRHPTSQGLGWDTTCTPCSLIGRAFHLSHYRLFTRGSQYHKNWLVCGRLCWGSNGGYSGRELLCWPLGHGNSTIVAIRQDQKIISYLYRAPYSCLTSLQPCYTFFVPNFNLPDFKFLVWPQEISLTFFQWIN